MFLAGQPRGSAQAQSFVAMDDLDHCDSCGDRAPDVVAVHRAYVTPAAWDTEEKVEVLDEVARWCFPCRTSSPHQTIVDQPSERRPASGRPEERRVGEDCVRQRK